MSTLAWSLLLITGALTLLYKRVQLLPATLLSISALIIYYFLGNGSWFIGAPLLSLTLVLSLLSMPWLRQTFITAPILSIFRKLLPDMSTTEREALEAGTVWWDGELFSGKPNWDKLAALPAPKLNAEEQAFVDGPVEQLCSMLNDWKINYEQGDLSEEIYEFIHKNKFLGMIIPKEYGGLDFSATAQISVLNKLLSVNTVAGNYISVPNSLGPGELLMKYGTDAQKSNYLPKLAIGEEIPCFGLTAPRAGSDATSIPDTGIVCKGMYEGKETIGIKLNFEKRYITLAPVATLIGLAFRLYDPDHLIGSQDEYGITCALIPRNTKGMSIGRRHFPIGSPFLNGPIQGKDVFVPVEFIIGGKKMAGKGWRMLVECLSVGRCISLPSASLSGAQRALAASSAYARIRKQFNTYIGKFEAIQEILARMAGKTYLLKAAIFNTGSAIDQGEEPSVPSAILKYHCTEIGREICNDAMDIHGGKAAIKGPNNYLSYAYETIPVAITVEGANILTRSLIIFGQGAIRCHPYIFAEMQAAQSQAADALQKFDKAFFGHIGFTMSNAVRSIFMGLTRSHLTNTPGDAHSKRYYQQINRFSSAFAFTADICMLTLGGSLKFREMLSARLGDMLSMLYLASMVLKHYENQGQQTADRPLVDWCCRTLLYRLQEQLHLLLRNIPNRFAAGILRVLVFPLGRIYSAPLDSLCRDIAEIVLKDNEARDRLLEGAYLTPHKNNPVGRLNALLSLSESIAPLEKKLVTAVKQGQVIDILGNAQIEDALQKGVITPVEAKQLKDYDEKVMAFIHVDDFDFDEIGAKPLKRSSSASNIAKKKTA